MMLVVFLLCFHGAAASLVRCVFLHGTGENITKPETSTDDTAYWGGDTILKYTPYCTSRVFIHEDTTNNGWDSAYLQERFCKVAVGENTATKEIEDAVVFTHSMGNLALAAAFKNGVCSLGASSRWYAASAPWKGSQAASWVEGLCANMSIGTAALTWLARELNYCDPHHPQASQGYMSLQVGYPGLSDLLEVAVELVSGALCGTSSYGITSQFSIPLEALDIAVGYGEDDDGMVGISSCTLPGKPYGENASNPFYKAAINHADGTCRDGNGDFGVDTRQPASWYASVGEALAARPLRNHSSVLV